MILKTYHNNKYYMIDTKKYFDISIPYNFNGEQPNFYGVRPGILKYLELNGIIYSVDEGAGCNVSEINLNIHCTGTHTECVGHILKNVKSIGQIVSEVFHPVILITVKPVLFNDTKESYHCSVNKNEKVITKDLIEREISKWNDYLPTAIVIRTMPNIKDKKYYDYSKYIPSFFTNDAIQYIVDYGIKHLVVDIPSIDRSKDQGILGNHRIFWGATNPSDEVNSKSINTITELTYIDDKIKDGFYFLNIQLPNFVCDAAPSRPIILKAD